VVLVPLQYNTDGSGRLPDTSPDQLKLYQDLLLAVYPLVDLQITVHDPVPFDTPLKGGNVDFDAMNEQMLALKESDGAPSYQYYYGLFNPADTFNKYCSVSCTTGQSYEVAAPADGTHRVGAGVGFTGEDSAWTFVHELGHMHGRGHAPCNVSNAEAFPYKGGLIGTWGYDSRSGKFFDPTIVADYMSYCQPRWTSDYTFQNIFDRILEVGAQTDSLSFSTPIPFRFLRSYADGSFEWGSKVMLSTRPHSRTSQIRFLDDKGSMIAQSQAAVVPISQDGKTSWLIPLPPNGARSVELRNPIQGVRRIALQ
jgi:hypothetical protein